MRAQAVTPLGLCRMMLEVLPECRLSVVYDDGSVIEKIERCKMGLLSIYKGCNNDPCPMSLIWKWHGFRRIKNTNVKE